MRSSTLTKSIGLLSAFLFAFQVLGADVRNNLYTDQFHLTGQNVNTVPYLDAGKKLISSIVTPTELLLLDSATSANTPSVLIKRDGSGNFSAGTITANLTGTATSAQPQYNFVNRTTNYNANIGDWVYANGSSFTVTLPDATAVGSSGKPVVVQHAGTSFSSVFTIATTGGQTITGPPNNTVYTTTQVAEYTNNEQMEFRADGGNWKLINHKSETGWIDLGNFMQYYTYTVSSAAATLAAVYSPAYSFTLVSAGNATAAATYIPAWIYTVSTASATAAAVYIPAFQFSVTAANATAADVYKDSNGTSYTVGGTIIAGTTLIAQGSVTPVASGVLTKFSGSGDATITYSLVVGNTSGLGNMTVSSTISGGTTLTTTGGGSGLTAPGALIKSSGTGDLTIQFSARTGQSQNDSTCTVPATIVSQTTLVATCTDASGAMHTSGTLVKNGGTGDAILPFNNISGESTGAGSKAYRVAQTIAAQTTLITQSEAVIPTNSSGKLGKISGTGDTVITYSAVAGAANLMNATTTIPTFYGSPTDNNWKVRRVEGEYLELWVQFYQTVAAVAGSGDYIWPWPAILPPISATASQALGGGAQSPTSQAQHPELGKFRWPMSGTVDFNAAAFGIFGFAIPWTSTSFRPFMGNYQFTNTGVAAGSTFMPASAIIGYNFRVKFPVTGLLP